MHFFPPTHSDYIIDYYFLITKKKNFGWKHAYVSDPIIESIKHPFTNESKIYPLCIIKNPYSWALSLYKKPYHFPTKSNYRTFKEFLLTPYIPLKRENLTVPLNPIQLWNIKSMSYLKIKEQIPCAHLIRYEDLLKEPRIILIKMFGETETSFENINNSTKNTNLKFNDYQEYYLKEEWKKEIKSEHYSIINHHLDQSLISRLGYQLIN